MSAVRSALGGRGRGWRRWVGAALAVLALSVQAAPTDQRQQNARITLYFGVMPAALSQAAVELHAAPVDPHRPARSLPDTHHFVVALFDTVTGQRISDATMRVRHEPPVGAAMSKPLVPMPLGDTLSFGNTFVISEGRDHRFRIEVRRGETVERFDVRYDNLHGGP